MKQARRASVHTPTDLSAPGQDLMHCRNARGHMLNLQCASGMAGVSVRRPDTVPSYKPP
jgi:hypothetical protein